MMNPNLQRIKELFEHLSERIAENNKAGYRDSALHAEDAILPILNTVFNLNLVNANRLSSNTPVIDLEDFTNCIYVQVTTCQKESMSQKIEDTYKNADKHGINVENLYFSRTVVTLKRKRPTIAGMLIQYYGNYPYYPAKQQ